MIGSSHGDINLNYGNAIGMLINLSCPPDFRLYDASRSQWMTGVEVPVDLIKDRLEIADFMGGGVIKQ